MEMISSVHVLIGFCVIVQLSLFEDGVCYDEKVLPNHSRMDLSNYLKILFIFQKFIFFSTLSLDEFLMYIYNVRLNTVYFVEN